MEVKKRRLYVSDMAVDVFYDRKIRFDIKHHAVVILAGFPDFVGPSTLTNFQIKLGNIVFQPHLKGTYDSAGMMSPYSVKESLKLLNKIIWDATASETPNGKNEMFRWKIDSIILIGHSFGGLLTLRYFSELYNIESVIFTSAALHYGARYGCRENGPEHYREVGKKYPYSYRLSPVSSWEDILEGNDKPPVQPYGMVSNVGIIYGKNDKYYDLQIINQNAIELVKKYISASSYRLLLAENVGHPVAELLTNEDVKRMLTEMCAGAIWES